MDARDHVRRRLLQVADDPPVRLVVVDLRAHEVPGEEVAHDPERQLCLLVDERRRGRRLRLRLDRLPEPLEEHEVALDVLGRRALGGGADDDAAALRIELLDDFLEARPLGVLEAPRDSDPSPFGTYTRKRPGREISVVRRAPFDFIGSLTACTMTVWPRLIRSWIFRAPFGPRAQAPRSRRRTGSRSSRGRSRRTPPPSREHVVHDAQVDVPRDRAPLRAFEIHLGDAVVLEDRDALLADVDRDHELALRCRKWCALDRCTASCAAPRLPALGLAVGLRRLLRPSRSGRFSGSSASVAAASPRAGFFLPRPPRLPRRRLFFGPAGDSSAGDSVSSCSAATCSGSGASGGGATSVAADSSAACSSCCLPKRNQRSAKGSFSSFGRARAPDDDHSVRPRAAWMKDGGRHDLKTGYQSD